MDQRCIILNTVSLQRSNMRAECRRFKMDRTSVSFDHFKEKIENLFSVNLDNARFFYTDQDEKQVTLSSDDELQIAIELAHDNQLNIVVEDFLAFVSPSGSLLDHSESSFLTTSDEELSDQSDFDNFHDYCRDVQPNNSRVSKKHGKKGKVEQVCHFSSKSQITVRGTARNEVKNTDQKQAKTKIALGTRNWRFRLEELNGSVASRSSTSSEERTEEQYMRYVRTSETPSAPVPKRGSGRFETNTKTHSLRKQTLATEDIAPETRSGRFRLQEVNGSVASSSSTSSEERKEQYLGSFVQKTTEINRDAFGVSSSEMERGDDCGKIATRTKKNARKSELDMSAYSTQHVARHVRAFEIPPAPVPKGDIGRFETDTKTNSLRKQTLATSTRTLSPLAMPMKETSYRSEKQPSQNALKANVKSNESPPGGVQNEPDVPKSYPRSAKPKEVVRQSPPQAQPSQRDVPDGSENNGEPSRNEPIVPNVKPNKRAVVGKGRNQEITPPTPTLPTNSWPDPGGFMKQFQKQDGGLSLENLGQIFLTVATVVTGGILLLVVLRR